MDRLGFKTHLAATLLRIWGPRAVDMVRANPYFMVAFVGWAVVDRIAQKMGISLDDSRRMIGAVEAAMLIRLKKKHTLTSHAGLRRRVQALLGPGFGPVAADQAIALARRAASALPTPDGRGYQTRPVATMENYLMDRIPKMVTGERDFQTAMLDAFGKPRIAGWAGLLDTCGVVNDVGAKLVEEAIQRFQANSEKILNVEQGNAVIMAAERPFFTLLGEAGTGKTCAIGAIHELAEGLGARVYQMALSGRAKEKLKKDTGRPALTIAKFIRMVGDGGIVLADGDLLIIDEASMLGLSTLFFIISAMPKGARLMLVGDPGQLPPVEFGLTFHVLANEESGVPQVKLKEIWRQRAATGIPKVANAIRQAHQNTKFADMIRRVLNEPDTNPLITPYQGRRDGVSFIDCPRDEIVGKMLAISRELGGCDNVQVVGVVKNGRAGTMQANLEFHKHLSTGKPRMPYENYAVATQ